MGAIIRIPSAASKGDVVFKFLILAIRIRAPAQFIEGDCGADGCPDFSNFNFIITQRLHNFILVGNQLFIAHLGIP